MSSYTTAYMSASLPHLLAPFVRQELLLWDPLTSHVAPLDTHDWYKRITTFCEDSARDLAQRRAANEMQEGESARATEYADIDPSKLLSATHKSGSGKRRSGQSSASSLLPTEDPDANLVPTLIARLVVPYVVSVLETDWDPLRRGAGWSLLPRRVYAEAALANETVAGDEEQGQVRAKEEAKGGMTDVDQSVNPSSASLLSSFSVSSSSSSEEAATSVPAVSVSHEEDDVSEYNRDEDEDERRARRRARAAAKLAAGEAGSAAGADAVARDARDDVSVAEAGAGMKGLGLGATAGLGSSACESFVPATFVHSSTVSSTSSGISFALMSFSKASSATSDTSTSTNTSDNTKSDGFSTLASAASPCRHASQRRHLDGSISIVSQIILHCQSQRGGILTDSVGDRAVRTLLAAVTDRLRRCLDDHVADLPVVPLDFSSAKQWEFVRTRLGRAIKLMSHIVRWRTVLAVGDVDALPAPGLPAHAHITAQELVWDLLKQAIFPPLLRYLDSLDAVLREDKTRSQGVHWIGVKTDEEETPLSSVCRIISSVASSIPVEWSVPGSSVKGAGPGGVGRGVVLAGPFSRLASALSKCLSLVYPTQDSGAVSSAAGEIRDSIASLRGAIKSELVHN